MSFHARTLTLPSLRRRAHPLPQIPERGPDSPLPDWDRCKTSSPSRLATLAPLDEEVLGGLILRCEGEARASPRPHPEVRGRSPSLEGRGRLLRNDPASGRGKKPLARLRERVPSASEAGEGLPILAQKPDLRLSVAPLIDEGEAVGRFE